MMNTFEFDSVAIPKSNYDHMYTTIANYEDSPLILGGFKNKKLEMYDIKEKRWVDKNADYPYSKA